MDFGFSAPLAASLKSVTDLARVELLHPGHGHGEYRCWIDRVDATQIDITTGLVFDTLELALTAATQGHGVAIGAPRMAKERLDARTLVMPFSEVAQNGLSYYLTSQDSRTR
jgi:DNA-binding transcriptional LysR family regulator